ncbi:MAG: hypothetical protein E6929_12415 [Clostridium sp.]|nr:hypothetical protein [Clostridium sp.]
MSDIPCIYDISMISEEEKLRDDILNGKSFDILLLLLSGAKTIREISSKLQVPSFSVQLYIQRLIDAKMIRIVEERVIEGKLEKKYELASTDVEILNYIKDNCKTPNGEENIALTAQMFASLTREIITNISTYKAKPYKIKAFFIKSDEKNIIEFKKELEELYEKYKKLEKIDATDTYGFISTLAPYNIENLNSEEVILE